jgi:hypothetical protein
MSSTTKTILLVGGVAAGAYFLAKALAPKPQSTSISLFGSGAGVTQGVLSGLGSWIGSLTSSSSSNPTPQQVRQTDLSNTLSYDSQGTYDAPVYGIAGLDY